MRRILPLLTALTAVATVGCDGIVSLRARVLDEHRVPIEGATVTLSYDSSTAQAVTGEDGCVELFDVVAPGRYPVAVIAEAPGREALTLEIETMVHYRCDLVLVTESGDDAGAADCEPTVDHEAWEADCPDPAWAGLEER